MPSKQKSSVETSSPTWLDQAVEQNLMDRTVAAQWLIEAAQQDEPLERFLSRKIDGHPSQSQISSLLASESANTKNRPTQIEQQDKDSTLGSYSNPIAGNPSNPGTGIHHVDDATMVGGISNSESTGNQTGSRQGPQANPAAANQVNSNFQSTLQESMQGKSQQGKSQSGSSRSTGRTYGSVGTDNWRQRTRELRSGFERYQIRQEIGRGGCGVVSTAFDTQMQRLVVIKQIISEATNNETAARFLNEAQITGQLSHPGIVPVYEMGQDRDGMPFYVMKHLDGNTLAVEVANSRQQAQATEKRASLHRLLQRFQDVCETLAYAHNCGVIHRDLKPANVMIGEFGETIVLDWGLARRIEDSISRQSSVDEQTVGVNCRVENEVAEQEKRNDHGPRLPNSSDSNSLTQQGAVLGTAAYMSPEQARGATSRLDQRTDVFSLGVMLYEMLSGKSPFRGDTLANTIENVRKCEYKPLRRVNRSVPRSLVAICHKAMAADPDDRYTDAGQLADDLQRYLSGQPVLAYQERWFEKLDRLAERHRTVFRSVFAASIVLAFAASVSTGIVTRAHVAEQEAHRIALAAKTEAENALQQEKLAHEIANRQLVTSRKAADNWLLQISADLQFYPGLQPIRSELFVQGLEHYSQLVKEGESALLDNRDSIDDMAWQNQTQLEISKNQIRIADLYQLQGDSQSAYTVFSEAAVALERLLDQLANLEAKELSDDLMTAVELQHANAQLGISLTDSKSKGKELAAETEAALLELLAENPTNHDVRNALVRARLINGRLVQSQDVEAAINCFRSALADVDVLIQADPSNRNTKLKENVLRDLAQANYNSKNYDQAEQCFSDLLRFYQKLPEMYQDRPDVLEAKCWTRSFIAGCCMKAGRSRDAIIQYEDALSHLDRAWEQLYGESFYRENQSAIEFNQGQLLASLGRDQEAIDATKSSMNQLRWVIQSTSPTTDRIQRMARIYLLLSELLAAEDWETASQWDQQTKVLLRHLSAENEDNPIVNRLMLQSDLLKVEHLVRSQEWTEAEVLLDQISGTQANEDNWDATQMRTDHARIRIASELNQPVENLLAAFVRKYTQKECIERFDSVQQSSLVIAAIVSQASVSERTKTQLWNYANRLVETYPDSEAAWTAFTVAALQLNDHSEAKKGLDRIKICRIDQRPLHQWLESIVRPASQSSSAVDANSFFQVRLPQRDAWWHALYRLQESN